MGSSMMSRTHRIYPKQLDVLLAAMPALDVPLGLIGRLVEDARNGPPAVGEPWEPVSESMEVKDAR